MTRRIAVLDNNPMDSAFVRAFPNDGEQVVAGKALIPGRLQREGTPVSRRRNDRH